MFAREMERLMGEYRVMQWSGAMDGPWSPAAVQKFRDEGFEGLVVVPGAGWTPADLGFLTQLEGLRSFSFVGKVKDDLGAFAVGSLEDLTLVTGSKLAVPDTVQGNLARLVLTDRPGLTVNARWPRLSALRVGEWKASDLHLLHGAAAMKDVYLEARRQRGSLEGVEACFALESLLIVNYSVAGIEPLSDLQQLSELKLLAARPTPPHETIDFSVLTSRRLTKIWISNAGRLLGFDALAERPMLRELRLIGCRLAEADLRALAGLPKWIDVQIVKG